MCGKQLLAAPLLGALLLAGAALPGEANPVLYPILLTHARPYDYYNQPIESCAELEAYTTASGWVDFEIYAFSMADPRPYGIDETRFQFTWPDTWYFDEGWYPIPHGGTGTVTVSGNHASVALSYPDCPTTAEDLFLLMRLSFWVEGYGALALVDGYSAIHVCTPYPGWDTTLTSYGAEAGVVCDHHYANCEEDLICQPGATTPLLELLVNQGDTVTQPLVFTVPSSNCNPVFAVTEPWLSIVVGPHDPYMHYPVTLTVRTSDLELGDYEGYVSATTEGAACTLVRLTVLDLTGVETTSWSRIKSFY